MLRIREIAPAVASSCSGVDRLLMDYFERTFRPLRLAGRKPKTVERYRINLRHFNRALGRPATLADLNDESVTMAMGWVVEARGDNNTTANNLRSHLLSIWRFAHRKGHVELGPDVASLREPKRHPRCWSEAQIALLVKTAYLGECFRGRLAMVNLIPANLFWTGLLLTVYDTGARIGAILKAPVEALDLETGHILIEAETQKQYADQPFKLTPETCAILKQIAHVERERLFPWPHSESTLYNHLRRVLKTAGLPHGRREKFHKIRRTTATFSEIYVGRGTATAYLGHSSAAVTRAYIDTTRLPDFRVAEQLPRLLLVGEQLPDGSFPSRGSMLPTPLPAPAPIQHSVAAVILPPAPQTPDRHPLLNVDPLELLADFDHERLQTAGPRLRTRTVRLLQRIIAVAQLKTVREIEAPKLWAHWESEFKAGRISLGALNSQRRMACRFATWLVESRGCYAVARAAQGLAANPVKMAELKALGLPPLSRSPKKTEASPERTECLMLLTQASAECTQQTTVREFFRLFYVPGRLRGSSERTLAVYIKAIGSLDHWLRRPATLGDLTRGVLEAFVRAELERGMAPATVTNRLGMLVAVGNHAKRCDIIDTGYAGLDLPAEVIAFRNEKVRRFENQKGLVD